MPRQRKLNVFGCARIQNVKENALTLFYPYRLPVSQTFSVNCEPPIADFPSIRSFLLLMSLLRLAPSFLILLVAVVHLFSPEEWLKLVSC